ncbi:MAG TPA: acetyl-CoA carboxylase biotin carboxyl carrier protein [Thermoanaerobaculia bacterium]|nr:acetyl-CoA carboxylase biotin carboxyl carrier protein [Thermoanaerobaculia bacterium]
MLTFEQMKELAELVARHRLSGLEVERSGFRFKVDGYPAAAAATPSAPAGYPPPAAAADGRAGLAGEALPPLPAAAAAPPPGLPVHAGEAAPGAMAVGTSGTPGSPGTPGAAGGTAAGSRGLHVLTSPIVGTFYRAPSPDSPPFVEVGSRVRKGQVMCIIEAMKLMNEIECDVDGTVAEIYPQNAQAVEFGEPLFGIQLSS